MYKVDFIAAENSEITYEVEKVLGRKAIDCSDYAREAPNSGIWNQKVNELI